MATATRTTAELAHQISAACEFHAVLDPPRGDFPPGEGHFNFLNTVDAEIALDEYGLTSAPALANQREQGNLPIPSRTDVKGPHIVWFPNVALLNPLFQPKGDGQWAYLTAESSRAAARDFGNRDGFGTAMVEHPSAAHLFRIREEFREVMLSGEYHRDLTEGIDLIWVPARAGGGVEDGATNAAAAPRIDYGYDNITGLAHEPTNGGSNDQTPLVGRKFHLQTRTFGNITVTMDRYAAKVGFIELHKLFIHNGAKWIQWHRASSMNWNDPTMVNDLNRWREQACRRADWPNKRGDRRENYTQEQRDYMFEMIVRNDGRTPSIAYKPLTKQFNEHFGLTGEQERAIGAIQSLVSKLCKEYQKYGGKQKPRDGKGDKQAKGEEEDPIVIKDEPQDSEEDGTGPAGNAQVSSDQAGDEAEA